MERDFESPESFCLKHIGHFGQHYNACDLCMKIRKAWKIYANPMNDPFISMPSNLDYQITVLLWWWGCSEKICTPLDVPPYPRKEDFWP